MGAALATLGLPAPRTRAAPDDRRLIQDLLDRRSTAVIEGDESAFMSTMADYSNAFVERQRRFFRSIQGLPLDSYELTVSWERVGDLAIDRDVKRYPGASEVSIPLTEERYALRPFDEEPAAEDIYYSFVKRDGRWLIASDTDVERLGLYSARHLWDYGSIHQARSENFLLLGHPCDEASTDACGSALDRFLPRMEEALQRVDELWTPRWNHEVLLLIPDDDKELSRMIQATFEVNNFVAFAYSTIDTERDLDYTGDRIMLNWDQIAARGDETIRLILAHELLHVATRDVAGPFIPIFVEEGIAEYVGYSGNPNIDFFNAEVAAGRFDAALPLDFEFTTGSGTDIYRSYQEGVSAVDFFIDRWGLARFIRFYKRLGRPDLQPGTARYHLDAAMSDTIGIGFDRFEDLWADSIAR